MTRSALTSPLENWSHRILEIVGLSFNLAPEVSASEGDPKRVKNYRYDFYLKSAEDQELEILRLENELREK